MDELEWNMDEPEGIMDEPKWDMDEPEWIMDEPEWDIAEAEWCIGLADENCMMASRKNGRQYTHCPPNRQCYLLPLSLASASMRQPSKSGRSI